ncbi:MAG: signal peptidase II, partial [Pseudomonadota bacterium]
MSESQGHSSSNEQDTDGGYLTYALWVLLAVVVVGLDQVSKLAIIRWVDLYQKIEITGFLNITHQQNTGAAFSFLADAGGWQRWFFAALATSVSAVLVVWLHRLRNTGQWVLSAGLALVLGGAVGNLIDRVRLGY